MDLLLAAEQAASRAESSGHWQLALVLGAIGFLGLFARWRKMRTPVLPSAKEMRQRDDNPNRYRDAADKAIVELLETSRTLNAQVDTKIRMLNRLVKEAEEQGTRLERLLARAEGAAIGEETVQFAPEGRKHSSRLVPIAGAEAGKKEEPRFLSDLHERIFYLREAGKTVPEIAKATNLSTTEVEFIVKTF